MTNTALRIQPWLVIALGFLFLTTPSTSWAQRYLTEFVGSSRITLSRSTAQALTRELSGTANDTATATSVFNITKISSQRDRELDALSFRGNFSLNITDGTSNAVVRKFSHSGFLFSNGDCTADLKRGDSSGNLDLVETGFDGEKRVFALIGTVGVDPNPSDTDIPNGVVGPSVFIRPALTQIGIPTGSRTLTLTSSGASSGSTIINLSSKQRNKTLTGTFVLTGSTETYQVVATASRKLLYLAGVSSTTYFTAKIPVTRSKNFFQEASGGTFKILNADNQVLESGAVSISALN